MITFRAKNPSHNLTPPTTSPAQLDDIGGRLVDLNIAGCALGNLRESDILFNLQRCPKLERIDLSVYLGGIGAAEGAALGTSCPKLSHVCLSRSKRLSYLGIVELARKLPELRSFDVSSSATCDLEECGVILRALGAHNHKLEHLNVSCVLFYVLLTIVLYGCPVFTAPR